MRLQGRDLSLKRSNYLEGEHPEWLADLERLEIFGWNGDYIACFRAILEDEGFARTVEAPVVPMRPFPKGLYVPFPRSGYTTVQETWRLSADGPDVLLDRRPKVASASGANAALAIETTAASGQEYRLDQAEIASQLDLQRLYLALLDHKHRRGHENLFVDKSVVPDLLGRCTLHIDYPLSQWDRLHTDAELALRSYVDRYVARCERHSENAHVAPVQLRLEEPPGKYLLEPPYQVRIHDQAIEKSILNIVSNRKQFASTAGSPLPRLRIDQHLYHPLLRDSGLDEGVSVSPGPLNAGETRLLETLTHWWADNLANHPGVHLYVLRNLPRIGVGLYRQSGFYPDFILWVKHSRPARQRIVLLEPHGLHHETPNALESDKVKALAAFRELGKADAFRKKRITLDGYIVSNTPEDQIPGGTAGKSRDMLATDHAVLLANDNEDWWVLHVLGL